MSRVVLLKIQVYYHLCLIFLVLCFALPDATLVKVRRWYSVHYKFIDASC